MVKNCSVPVDGVLPHVAYQDVGEAIRWLGEAFGFVEHYRYGGEQPQGAQVYLGAAWIMLERLRGEASGSSMYLTVIVDQADAHYERAQAAGARIVEALNETVYGERQYVALDHEGNRWLFSQHLRDLSPEDWGARVATDPFSVPGS